MRIGVMGARGLIGGGIAAYLSEGHTVIPFSRAEGAGMRVCDLAATFDPALFADLECLVHAAGPTDEALRDLGDGACETLFLWTHKLFDQALSAGCRTLVYISTAHVYGRLNGRVTEETPINPQSRYADLHVRIEDDVHRLAREYGARAIILRPNAVYGRNALTPHFTRWGLIPFAFPAQAVREGKLVVKSPGTCRNFVSSDQIGRVVAHSLLRPFTRDVSVIHPLGPEMLTVGAFARRVQQVIDDSLNRHIWIEEGVFEPSDFVYASDMHVDSPDGELDEFLTAAVRFFEGQTEQGGREDATA